MSDTGGRDAAEVQRVRWHPVADIDALQWAAFERVVDAANRAIDARGQFLVVLSGGNTPRGVYTKLRGVDTDWSRWQVYFGDERCLAADDPGRNSAMAADAWLDHVSIPRDQVHVIPAELGAQQAAQDYANALRGVHEFDLVLLGLGEDGHTASLFPDHELGAASDAPDTLAIIDAPKPPPQRVSLSAARLGRASEVVFLIDGEPKRDAVAKWRGNADIPARAIRPTSGVDVLVTSSLMLPRLPTP
jgi:6-phosphogluconolactonase